MREKRENKRSVRSEAFRCGGGVCYGNLRVRVAGGGVCDDESAAAAIMGATTVEIGESGGVCGSDGGYGKTFEGAASLQRAAPPRPIAEQAFRYWSASILRTRFNGTIFPQYPKNMRFSRHFPAILKNNGTSVPLFPEWHLTFENSGNTFPLCRVWVSRCFYPTQLLPLLHEASAPSLCTLASVGSSAGRSAQFLHARICAAVYPALLPDTFAVRQRYALL